MQIRNWSYADCIFQASQQFAVFIFQFSICTVLNLSVSLSRVIRSFRMSLQLRWIEIHLTQVTRAVALRLIVEVR